MYSDSGCPFFFCRKRQREQEIAEEEAAKKKKEWEKQWEVSLISYHHVYTVLHIFPVVLKWKNLYKDLQARFSKVPVTYRAR